MLWRALRDSQIEHLSFWRSGLHSIEIDDDCVPSNLKYLSLTDNNINSDGCREIAKQLQKVIHTQLNSKTRAEMCRLQGLGEHLKAPFTELGPLLLPEALEVVGKHHGLCEFYETFMTNVALWMSWMLLQRKGLNSRTEGRAGRA